MACFYPNRSGAVKPGRQPRMIPHPVPTEREALPRKQQSPALFCLLSFPPTHLYIGFGWYCWDAGDVVVFNFALNFKNIIKDGLVDCLMW